MAILKRLFWRIAVPGSLGALVVWLAWLRVPTELSVGARKSPRGRNSAAAVPLPLVGTPSCSARGCHGAIEPVVDGEKCQQTEYTRWAKDRHADAFRTLYSERSQNMVKILGGGKPAHEDPRCLACHTNPSLAALPVDLPFVQEERLFGVGCESCHGSAKIWLVAHTSPDWRKKKQAYAMPDLSDPAVAARSCVGCHVGAPPGAESTPERNVNHDLLAAGHPRLTFEFATYQANMPPHWRSKVMSDGRRWAAGQIASAQAALELLGHRAKSGPWPEFAEYDCFACHHGLASSGWRPGASDTNRKPGTLPWGTWYFALTDSVTDGNLELATLRSTMQLPYPNRTRSADQAELVRARLKKAPQRTDDYRKHLLAQIQDKKLRADDNWDGAEQVYLALHALNQTEPDPVLARALGDVTPLRAYPPGFDGPLRFDPHAFFERLRRMR